MIYDDRIKLFEDELNAISSDEVRNFVKQMFITVPDYFFTVPASSTGKYHPNYALGNQGLIRHTKAAVRIACELFTIHNFLPLERDYIIAALMLHDCCKNGIDGKEGDYTLSTHPLEACTLINNAVNKSEMSETICDLIASHMGQWNTDWKTGQEILPKPKSEMQFFVHMCDYLASRKCLEFNFDIEISRRW